MLANACISSEKQVPAAVLIPVRCSLRTARRIDPSRVQQVASSPCEPSTHRRSQPAMEIRHFKTSSLTTDCIVT